MMPPIQAANFQQHLQNSYPQYHDPYREEVEPSNRRNRKFTKSKEIRRHESYVTSRTYHHAVPEGLALSSSRCDGGGYQNKSGLLDIIHEEGPCKVASYDSDTQRRRPLNRPSPNECLCFMCGQDLFDDDAFYTLNTTRSGVDTKVQRQSVHADCFQCATCGLKFDAKATKAFAIMDEKLYCEMHAQQRRKVFGGTASAGNNDYKNSSTDDGTDGDTPSPTNPPVLSRCKTNIRMTNQLQQGEKRPFQKPQQVDDNYRKDNQYCKDRKGPNRDDSINQNQPLKIKKYIGIENRNKNLPPNVAPSFKRVFVDAPNVPPMGCDERTVLKETLQSSTFIQDLRKNLENCQKAIKENRSSVTSNRRVAFSDILSCRDEDESLSDIMRQQPNIEKSKSYDDSKKSINYVEKVNRGGANDHLVCESCREPIRGSHVLALGKYWCADHFKCANPACACPLVNCSFIDTGEADGSRNYCESCYETLIAPICTKCGLPIVSDCLNAMKKKWHPECFICTHCRQPFAQNQDGSVGGKNLSFYVENNRPYCENDWNELFTQKCVKCTRPVQAGESFIEAFGSTFHSKCFRCEECNIGLSGRTFFAHNNRPYCRSHCNI